MEKIEYPNGDVYEGEVKDNLPHGKGKIIKFLPEFDRKVEYIGDFKNGLREGYGKSIVITGPSKGSSYEGEWKNDKQHGKGKTFFITPDGKQNWYGDGNYVDSWLDGQCNFKVIDLEDEMKNTEYVGEMKENQYHGKGTLTRRLPVIATKTGEDVFVEVKITAQRDDGDIVDGPITIEKRWVWGSKSRDVPGYSPVHKHVGIWENNSFVRGKKYTGHKLEYDGEWKDYSSAEGFSASKQEGYGIEYALFENEKMYEGYFKNDLRHGKGTITYNDGTKKECEYKEGKEI